MSDQDFFFDEEPETQAPAPKAPKTTTAKAPKAPAAPVVDVDDDTPALERSTSWAVAILIGVVGLLIGAIGGFLLGNNAGGTAPVPSAGTAPAASSPAPELSNEQIQSGELPAGHPQINASGTADTTDTSK